MANEPTVQEILGAIPMPSLLLGRDGTVLSGNGGAATVFGPALPGRHFAALFRDPALSDRIEAALKGAAPTDAAFEKRVDGSMKIFRLAVSPINSGGAVLTLADETPAHAASAMRSEFVANVSHELRTPLTALTGMIETLQGPAAGDEVARVGFLAHMAREAARMNRLVQDLLSLSRVESDDVRDWQRMDLCRVVNAAVASLADQAARRQTRVRVAGCSDAAMLTGDPDQLRQVFNNLIENAIKYGAAAGEVTISVTPVAYEPLLRGAGIRVDVTDRGEGIAEEHIVRLTERFYRVDKHRSRETGGTGLGLAIVKHILTRHGGRLRITSELGSGSCFTVFLPAN